MIAHRSRHRANIAQAVLVPTLLLGLLLTGCTTAGSSTNEETGLDAASRSPVADSPTPSATSALPPIFDRPVSDPKVATIQAEREAHATWAASGIWPTVSPYPIATAAPIATPVLGFGGWCDDADREYAHGGCWTGRDNNEYLIVTSDVWKPDPTNSWLRVYTSTLDLRHNGSEQKYFAPGSPGLLYMAQVNGSRMMLVTASDSAPLRQFVFNLQTRAWETSGPCPLVPLAVATDIVQSLHAREAVTTTFIPDFGDKIRWLTWSGDQSDAALARSLILPGDGDAYRNPDNPDDHALTTGKWVHGRAPAPTGAARATLQRLIADHIMAVWPVWDQRSGAGADTRYHVTGFVWLYFSTAGLTDPNQVTVRYWGQATCPPGP